MPLAKDIKDKQDNIKVKDMSEEKEKMEDRKNSKGWIKTKEKKEPEGIHIKQEKDGTAIYITIYNNNNLANDGGNAGVKQSAESGGQITGKGGQNANQGGQIAEECGQNANQDGKVKSRGCGQKIKKDADYEEACKIYRYGKYKDEVEDFDD